MTNHPGHAESVSVLEDVRKIVGASLQLGAREAGLIASSPLVGSIPEFDSMAVVAVITALEEHFGFTIEDDEISGETFATLGELARFVEGKLAA